MGERVDIAGRKHNGYLEVRLHALAHGGVQPEGGLGPVVGRAEPFQGVPVHLVTPRGTPMGRSEGGE